MQLFDRKRRHLTKPRKWCFTGWMMPAARGLTITERINRLDWQSILEAVNAEGFATVPPLLSAQECSELRLMYGVRERFRSRVEMARFRFGVGEYKYFAAPLPPIVLNYAARCTAALCRLPTIG